MLRELQIIEILEIVEDNFIIFIINIYKKKIGENK